MNWFNIVLVLFFQSFLFFYISSMYGKHNKWFITFSALFLVLSLINIITMVIMIFIIINGNYTDKFTYFGDLLFYVQIGFMVMIMFFYILKMFFDGFEGVNNAIKK